MNHSQFIALIITKVQMNLKSEAAKSYLSYLWWLFEPALFVGVFYIVFGILLAQGTSDFLVFLLCGQIPFLWFARTVGNASASIEQGAGLMQQINIPKIFFPIVVIFQDSFKSLCIFILFFGFLLLNGTEVTVYWFAIPIIMLAQLLFISCISIFVAMIVPFLPDLKFLISTGIQLLMFGSGIFYNYKDVLIAEHMSLFLLNPMANLIAQYRLVLIEQVAPSWFSLLIIILGCSVVLVLLSLSLKKLDEIYPRLLTQ